LPLPEETQGLLLVARGAEVPSWLDTPCLTPLEQSVEESMLLFGERACEWLAFRPTVAHVVVALATETLGGVESGLAQFGLRLAKSLASRQKARLLLCVPAEVTERQRKALLSLTGELAKVATPQSSVVVGAHFSARPPPSGTLPIHVLGPAKNHGSD